MAKLSDKLVKEFVRMTNDTSKKKSESFLYGTVDSIEEDGTVNVVLDGSDIPTPCSASVSVAEGDRVLLMLKNRQGVITSNISNPTININTLEADTITARNAYEIYIVRDGKPILKTTFARMSYNPALDDDEDDQSVLTLGEEGDDMWIASSLNLKKGMASEDDVVVNADTEGDNAGDYIFIGENPLALKELQVCVQAPSFWGIPGKTALFYGTVRNASDRTLKHDICDTDETDALSKVNAIKHRKFVWNEGNKPESLGYIAQELREIDRDLASGPDGYCTINNLHLIALATKSIQELSAKVDTLERRVKELESKRNKELSD